MSLADTLNSLEYRTPPGYVDVPYAYVYDATALGDGTNQSYLALNLDGDSDFILRQISGASLCAASFRPYYSGRRYMFQNLIRSVANWPVLPEALYGRDSQILFDLGTVTRAFNVGAGGEPNIYTSFLAFQGVRRYKQEAFPLYRTKYDYREIPRNYSIVIKPGSHWTNATDGVPNYPQTFSIPMLEGDFELLSTGVTDLQTFAPPTLNAFQMRLYDAQGWFRFSDAGFNLFCFNSTAPQVTAVPAVNNWYQPQYPTPSTVYPNNGVIKFEITSLLPFAQANNLYQIDFYGIHRQRNGTHE